MKTHEKEMFAMKVLRNKKAGSVIGLLLAAILTFSGCTSRITCHASYCDEEATRKCHNVYDPEDVEYYCDSHCPRCLVCQLNGPFGGPYYASEFERAPSGVMFHSCAKHDLQDNPVSGGIVG